MSPNAYIDNNAKWALFLDVDGTLLEIAETPHDVQPPERLKDLLNRVCVQLDGALALVSGRSLANIDELFAPYRYCAAGLHGFERRDPAGRVHAAPVKSESLASAREQLATFVAAHEGLLLEDKGQALALHFRRAPQLGPNALAAASAALSRLGPDFTLQAGKCVYELRPSAYNKGVAVAAFAGEAPFADRTLVYVGDDLTDEHAFSVVNGLGGVSVRVGAPSTSTQARYRFASVSDVLAWLEAVAQDRQSLVRAVEAMELATCD